MTSSLSKGLCPSFFDIFLISLDKDIPLFMPNLKKMDVVLAKRDNENPNFSPFGANHGCASLYFLCINPLHFEILSAGPVVRQHEKLECHCIFAQNTLKTF